MAKKFGQPINFYSMTQECDHKTDSQYWKIQRPLLISPRDMESTCGMRRR
jgi:hypothetical protein